MIPRAVAGALDYAWALGGAVVIAGGTGGVEAWSMTSGERLPGLPNTGPAATVATDPAGTVLLVGGATGTVTAIDFARRMTLWQKAAHTGEVSSVVVGPGGRRAASGGEDAVLRVWDMTTGESLRSIATQNGRVRNLAFDSKSARVAATGYWRTRMWDLDRPADPPRDFGSSEGMTDLHISPDDHLLSTTNGVTGLVRVWDLGADPRTDHWLGEGAAVTGLSLTADAGSIVDAELNGTLSIRHPGSSAAASLLRTGARVSALAISGDGRWIATVGEPGTGASGMAAPRERPSVCPKSVPRGPRSSRKRTSD